jgi:methylenetetrahydrofolate reductase (NADPH)
MLANRPTVSFEFFPPKDAAGEAQLWDAIAGLAEFAPDFVSVTYGAGGSTRDRTIAIACEIFERTGYRTIAHLTCVGSTRDELIEILNQYKRANIHDILALRGDPVGGPTAEWTATPSGLNHADELVELATSLGGFNIGVAAFPDVHPASHGDFEQDIEVLLRKEALGATFAITQFIFDSARYAALVEALAARGSKLIVHPGIMAVTNYRQITRMLELSGGSMPAKYLDQFEAVKDDVEGTKELGIEIASQICHEVHAAGAQGFHFYTLNTSTATAQVVANLSSLLS